VSNQIARGFNMGSISRVALVTGGTVGIGAPIAEALLAAGYRVAFNYGRNVDAAHAFEARSGINAYAWNVANWQACNDGVARVQTALGPVEELVNNAGITRDAMLHKLSAEQWREVIDVDLDGCFNMCRSAIEGMRERQFGRIVNISSVNALSGQAGQTNYAAAKAGTIGFTKSLARVLFKTMSSVSISTCMTFPSRSRWRHTRSGSVSVVDSFMRSSMKCQSSGW
jgi:acetoacetyl-CoA reductase